MQTLSTQQVDTKIESNDNALLINVLSGDHFNKKHIPGSINIPYDQDDFAEQVEDKVSGKDQEIIVYCASESCSASPKAAEKLEKAGFSNVFDYEGGIKDWEKAGKELHGSEAESSGSSSKAKSSGCC